MAGAAPRRAIRAAEGAGKDEEAPCCDELAPAVVEVAVGAGLVAAVAELPSRLASPARARMLSLIHI